MKTRQGGKFGKSHSTMTEAGALIAALAAQCEAITRVIHGPITTHRGSSGSSRRVKVRPDNHVLRVSVTANANHQILFVHTSDFDAAKKHIEAGARKRGFEIGT